MSAAGNALIVGVGAAKGLGAAAARVFAAAGFDVTIAGRNATKLEEAAKSIAAAGRAAARRHRRCDDARRMSRASCPSPAKQGRSPLPFTTLAATRPRRFSK